MTKISWCDETWNPTDGCEVCSPGCANCYAMRFAGRFAQPGERYHGLVTIGKNKRAVWSGEARLDNGKLDRPMHWKKPRRIFVNSMSDLFYEGFTNEQIAAVFGVMAACPQHTFQVLTKRAKRMREWFAWVDRRGQDGARMFPHDDHGWRVRQMLHVAARGAGADVPSHHGGPWPLPNVWLGVSVENQPAADERIPELRATPAAVRFVSCEPLLGPLLLDDGSNSWLTCTGPSDADDEAGCCESRAVNGSCYRGIDWVIVGCESGPGARACDVAWLRALRDQCASAEVAFWLKQAVEHNDGRFWEVEIGGDDFVSVQAGPGSERKAGGVIELPYLDGVQHANFPKETT